jgi:hypothetical protein
MTSRKDWQLQVLSDARKLPPGISLADYVNFRDLY